MDFDPKKKAMTIWKDGSWKVWGTMDAYYARNDPDWLAETGLEEIISAAVQDDQIPAETK